MKDLTQAAAEEPFVIHRIFYIRANQGKAKKLYFFEDPSVIIGPPPQCLRKFDKKLGVFLVSFRRF